MKKFTLLLCLCVYIFNVYHYVHSADKVKTTNSDNLVYITKFPPRIEGGEIALHTKDNYYVVAPKEIVKNEGVFGYPELDSSDSSKPLDVIELSNLFSNNNSCEYLTADNLANFYKYILKKYQPHSLADAQSLYILAKDLGYDEEIIQETAQIYLSVLKDYSTDPAIDPHALLDLDLWTHRKDDSLDKMKIRNNCINYNHDIWGNTDKFIPRLCVISTCSTDIMIVIDISECPITRIDEDFIFKVVKRISERNAEQIVKISFVSNQILKVDYDALCKLFVNLKAIDLSNNLIYMFDGDKMSKISQIEVINLRNNPLLYPEWGTPIKIRGLKFLINANYTQEQYQKIAEACTFHPSLAAHIGISLAQALCAVDAYAGLCFQNYKPRYNKSFWRTRYTLWLTGLVVSIVTGYKATAGLSHNSLSIFLNYFTDKLKKKDFINFNIEKAWTALYRQKNTVSIQQICIRTVIVVFICLAYNYALVRIAYLMGLYRKHISRPLKKMIVQNTVFTNPNELKKYYPTILPEYAGWIYFRH